MVVIYMDATLSTKHLIAALPRPRKTEPQTPTQQPAAAPRGNQTSTGDLDGLHLRHLHLVFGHRDGEHAVLHARLHLIHLGVLRQPEPPQEPPAAPLHPVPLVVLLLLLLPAPLPADLEHPAVLHLHLHLLLLHPREVRLEHVRLRRLLPVDSGVGDGPRLARQRLGEGAEGVEGEAMEGVVEEVKGEGVEDVAAPDDGHA